MSLNTPISQLNRVGKVLERNLKHLQIETVEDLLNYFPFRYEDYSEIVPIQDLPQKEGQQVTVRGKIELIANKRSPRKRKVITEAVVADDTGQLRIIWFGQPFIKKILYAGDEVFFSGKVKSDMFGINMVSPGYEKARNTLLNPPSMGEEKGDVISTTHTARIVPMYSLTSGITHKQIRFLMTQAMKAVSQMKDWLPNEIRDRIDIMEFGDAIKAIHFPKSKEELKHAERRLKFDELFILQLRAELIRQSIKQSKAPQIRFDKKAIKEFVDSLPFKLTDDQKIAAWEIIKDLEREAPMNRLLEGDVGSGKTVVAAIALYSCILNNYQGVIMAPTEILAKQHFETLSEAFALSDVKIGLFTRSKKMIYRDKIEINRDNNLNEELSPSISTYLDISKKSFLKEIDNGELQIVIGTHALLTGDVKFKDLGLVIVDEQHRFGVEQRKTIREKSGDMKTTPHFLSMTATPIPRSFALTLYGDLDLSIIKQMPKGRKPVQTRLVDPHNRDKAYGFIREQVKEGRQVFVVCPLIEERGIRKGERGQLGNHSTFHIPHSISEKKTVMQEYEKLSKNIFPDLKIGYLHGKMKDTDKDSTMEQFTNGTIDILVSTSVVEVGVDIPNASVMMIEGAERFGLAQLHQFRGRVGRSSHQSYCFLFTDSNTEKVKERLALFESTTDGFKLAEHDLEIRGPGEVYGFAQSGMMNFKLATYKDQDLIKLARDVAREIDFNKCKSLREKVEKWEERVHLE